MSLQWKHQQPLARGISARRDAMTGIATNEAFIWLTLCIDGGEDMDGLCRAREQQEASG
jgi:hypothetical protein